MQSLFNLLNEDISIWQNMKPTKFPLRTSAKKFFSNATSRRQTSTNAGICWDMHGREIYDDDHPCRKFEMRHVKIASASLTDRSTSTAGKSSSTARATADVDGFKGRETVCRVDKPWGAG